MRIERGLRRDSLETGPRGQACGEGHGIGLRWGGGLGSFGSPPLMTADDQSRPETASRDLRVVGGAWAVLVLGTLLLFAPVLDFAFVNYDDNVFVYENAHVVNGLTAEGIRWAFTAADIDYWRPLSWLSHMLDVELYGLDAGGHHVTSVLIHGLAAGMLFSCLLQLTGRWRESFVVAALFAWHPLHVESVAWIAERKDVLCGLFWFAAVYFYARYARRGGRGNYAGLLAAFVAGLMSKPMIITLPFQLLLLDLWPLGRIRIGGPTPWRRLLLEKLPLFLLVGAACAATFMAQHQVGTVASTETLTVGRRLLNVPEAYLTYLWKAALPIRLAVFYPLLPAVNWVGSILGLVVLAAGSWFALRRVRAAPWLFVGWCWFLGTLEPVIGLVQVGGQRAADRYTYIALVGGFLAVVWTLRAVTRRREIAMLALGVCVVLTHFQIRHWRDGKTLYRHALAVTEGNHLALYNLARLHLMAREYPEAAELLRRADAVLPHTPEILLNLGTALHEGRISAGEAEQTYLAAAALEPRNPAPLNNLGNLLAETGRATEALTYYQRAIEADPTYVQAHYNLAGLFVELKRFDEAIAAYQQALALAPQDLDTRLGLIGALNEAGRLTAAAGLAHETANGHPDSFEASYNAAVLLRATGRTNEAIRHFENARRLNPGFAP